jgi:predicted Zn-ribbon and HTH transcriptional regulator
MSLSKLESVGATLRKTSPPHPCAQKEVRALKHIDALSPLLENERDADDARLSTRFLNPLQREITRQLEHLIRTPGLVSRVPRNLPGDPWLKPCVRVLARYLRACKVSQHRTEGIIERIFVVTGHQDRVTREKVRHILREARRSDPHLGLTPATIKKLPFLLRNERAPNPKLFP